MEGWHHHIESTSRQFMDLPGKEYSAIKLWAFLMTGVLMVCGCGSKVLVFGLRPEYPEVCTDFVEVDSLQPTLRWQAFPRAEELEADQEGVLRRIQHVTYELRIARAEEDFPVEIVYAKSEIPTSSHTLEEALEPSTEYFWTVRARFELDGHPRVMEWGGIFGISAEARRLVPIPNASSFRFKTPAAD